MPVWELCQQTCEVNILDETPETPDTCVRLQQYNLICLRRSYAKATENIHAQ